jgi:hypothetical protein
VIGEVFDYVYSEGGTLAQHNVQTPTRVAVVPAHGLSRARTWNAAICRGGTVRCRRSDDFDAALIRGFGRAQGATTVRLPSSVPLCLCVSPCFSPHAAEPFPTPATRRPPYLQEAKILEHGGYRCTELSGA